MLACWSQHARAPPCPPHRCDDGEAPSASLPPRLPVRLADSRLPLHLAGMQGESSLLSTPKAFVDPQQPQESFVPSPVFRTGIKVVGGHHGG